MIAAFFTRLPDKFQRGQAVEIGKSLLKIAERTVDKYLSHLVDKALIERDQKSQGLYRKSRLKK